MKLAFYFEFYVSTVKGFALEVIDAIESFPDQWRGGALAIGKFDGMHDGHSLILSRLREYASQPKIPAVALTFEPLPIRVLRPDLNILPLTTTEEKIKLLASQQIDALVICPANPQFLARTAEDFFENTIRKTFDTRVIVEGSNFTFGHNREGTPEKLRQWCADAGILFEPVQTIFVNNEPVSSSRIKTLLTQEGNAALAKTLLGRPYRVTGTVITGEQRGRLLGFPTANLGNVKTVIPKTGLYAATVSHAGTTYAAAVHIGDNPTFGTTPLKIECFLIDFHGDLYGQTLHVDFLARLRDVIKFASAEELLVQMHRDIDAIKKLISIHT
ncbi:MAG: riboflavin biosynthesis protein RibF [Planctomycetaceae bacterium]|nr:riboflavin biosynthesis protein RibF [Planctomycetaceae bacterium]